MKTIVLFGFLLSMTVLISEASLLPDLTGSTRLCKDDGSVLSPVLKLLSGTLAGLGSELDETAKELCKGNVLATVCELINSLLGKGILKEIPALGKDCKLPSLPVD
ncbi:UNVERIFIED_CONTAM: hypothetical protein RMT77_001003 [Armadillidium vulgare]